MILIKSEYIKHKILNLINISKIVTIHYFEFAVDFISEEDCHNFWELIYIDNGEAIITLRNKKHRLKRRELIFIKPNESHKLCSSGDTPPNVFVISFVCSSKSMDFFKNKTIKLPANLKHYISSMIEEGKSTFELPLNIPYLKELKLKKFPPVGGQHILRTYLEQLLIMLIRCEQPTTGTRIFPSKQSMEKNLVASIIEILGKNIYGTLSIEKLCTQLHYSKSYLSKLFADSCNYTIKEYYLILKVSEAKKLIKEGNYNFTEISDMLNFNKPHYFSRAFKRIAKMTPTEYLHNSRLP